MPPPLRCPNCGKDLQEILSEGEPIDYCTGCRGAFLDRGEPAAFTHFPERVLKGLADELLSPQPSRFRCPRCGGKMTEGALFDLNYRLDRCDACGGVWFDAHELSQLEKIEPTSRPAPAAKPKPAPTPPPSTAHWRCPSCYRAVELGDRWQCSCRNVWNPFLQNDGTCPKCGRVWDETKCPACGQWAPRRSWHAG